MPLRPYTPRRLIPAVPGVGALVGVAVMGLCAAGASAQPDPSDIDFVSVRAVGNAAWPGNGTPGDYSIGRGSVGYEFNIGRYEVTTSQWVDFMNAAFDRPAGDTLPHVNTPAVWGGQGVTPTNSGGRRWTVPAGREMRAVGGISWRTAAMYCNWLHNDKSLDRAAFLTGAYDVGTFGTTPGGRFTDQLTRSAGARFWIPSWDEMLKASHYDPAKVNADGTTGGWWLYNNSSDAAPIPGPPGFGTANFAWDSTDFPGFNPFAIPLGAYSTTSPWGLYDTSGGAAEWTERAFFLSGDQFPSARYWDGSWWWDGIGSSDLVMAPGGGEYPQYADYELGLRVAAAVPGPGASGTLFGLALLGRRRRRPCPTVPHLAGSSHF